MKKLRIIIVNICRLLLALTFILSGYVKAVDPLGTQYKLNDYLMALSLSDYVPDAVTLGGAIALAGFEFSLGIFLFFAVRRRIVPLLILLLMAFMTALTVWIYAADPVKDCGCFGDAIKLTNGETLVKNVVLLVCAVVVQGGART